MALPHHFNAMANSAWGRARAIDGTLDEPAFRALMVLAMIAPTPGAIVEVGSLMGRSTIGLATMSQLCEWGKVFCVDRDEADTWQKFKGVLIGSGLNDSVEARQSQSAEVLDWQKPIRLLSIAGIQDYPAVLEEFRRFAPHVIPGGFVVIHGTHEFLEGPIRVFLEEVLRNEEYGAAGFAFNFGWAQHLPSPELRQAREALTKDAADLLPLVAPPRREAGMNGLRYRMARARITSDGAPLEAWAAQL